MTPLLQFVFTKNRIKYLVIGDPHLKEDFLLEARQLIDATLKLIEQERPDFIVILGDVMDKHSKLDQVPLKEAQDWIKKCAKFALTFVLIGNHDRVNNKDFMSDIHPFTGLEEYPGIVIVSKTIKVKMGSFCYMMVPYVFPGRFGEALSFYEEEKLDTRYNNENISLTPPKFLEEVHRIFTHQEFKGCKFGGQVSEKGDLWPSTYPTTINGHIHLYQFLNNNMLYVGASGQHAYGDPDDKTVSMIEDYPDENGRVVFKETRHELDVCKKKLVHILSHEVKGYVLRTEPNVKIKVIINGPLSDKRLVMDMNEVKVWKENGIVVKYKDDIDNKLVEQMKALIPDEKVSFDSVFLQRIQADKLACDAYRRVFITKDRPALLNKSVVTLTQQMHTFNI